jgi:hypothetical protein
VSITTGRHGHPVLCSIKHVVIDLYITKRYGLTRVTRELKKLGYVFTSTQVLYFITNEIGLKNESLTVNECLVCGKDFESGNASRRHCQTCAPDEKFRWRCFNYGIGKPGFDLLLQTCENKCSMCLHEFTESNPPFIDHDHKTGKVRGLLHRRCNGILGLIEDFEFLQRSLSYAGKSHWLLSNPQTP